jgi:Family of unknown function (DUF7002)
MDATLFYKTYPRLYHMAHHEALPQILKYGLLSTSALLDLFEIHGERRVQIETRMRPASIVIEHPKHGRAVIRDQKPIVSDKRLAKALAGTATTAEWHLLLNSKVFFWVNRDRLDDLRRARAYRHDPQLILTLDTQRVVEATADKIWLCSINSGCCIPFPHERSPDRFRKLVDYAFDLWRRKKGGADKAVVECAIDGKLSGIKSLLISAEVVA